MIFDLTALMVRRVLGQEAKAPERLDPALLVLRRELLHYLESKESAYQAARPESGDAKRVTPLGTIRMHSARITKQRSNTLSEKMADNRHALMISGTSAEKTAAELCAVCRIRCATWRLELLFGATGQIDPSPFQDSRGSVCGNLWFWICIRANPRRVRQFFYCVIVPQENGSQMTQLMPIAVPDAAGQSNVFGIPLDQAVA